MIETLFLFFQQRGSLILSERRIIIQAGAGGTPFFPKIRTARRRSAVTGQRPEIMYGPDNRAKHAQLPDVADAEKIAMSIVKMDNVDVFILDKSGYFAQAVRNAQAVVPVVMCDETVQQQARFCIVNR